MEIKDADQGRPSSILILSRKRTRRDSARSLLQSIAATEASALARASDRRLACIRARHDDAQAFDEKRVRSALDVLEENTASAAAKTAVSFGAATSNGVTSSSSLLESSPSSSSSTTTTTHYRGRPLSGHTSGALYLHAEHTSGFPAMKRDEFVYPLELNPDPLYSGGGGGGSGGISTGGSLSTSSTALAEARESLKRPSFPSKGFPVFVGNAFFRKVAIAKDFDDLLSVESLLNSDTRKAVDALRR